MAEFFSVLLAPELFPAHVVFLFIFGLLAGSFLNVCIYRIPAGMSIVYPGSHCTACGHYLKWYENIPVFSYLFQGGQCRRCGAPFSPRYMLVELLTALTFVGVMWMWRYNWATPLYLVFTGMLIVGTFTDIDHWIIPDSMTWGGAAVALAVTLPLGFLGGDFTTNTSNFLTATSGPFVLEGQPSQFGYSRSDVWTVEDEDFVMPASSGDPGRAHPAEAEWRIEARTGARPDSGGINETQPAIFLLPFLWRFDARLKPLMPLGNALIGAVFGFGLLWIVGAVGKLFFRKEAMGMGDMKLFAFIGAIVGWFNCLWVLVLACVFGIVIHVSIALARRIAAPRAAPAAASSPAIFPEESADEQTESATPPSDAPTAKVLMNDTTNQGESDAGDAESADAREIGSALPPAEEREQRILTEILSHDVAAAPNYHPLPFGPYIAMAAYVVLLYHDRLNAMFRIIVLGIE